MIIFCLYDNKSGDCIYSFRGKGLADLKHDLSISFNYDKPIRDYLSFLKKLSLKGYRVELVIP